ncbi:hypothetical protein BGZ58_003531, partial [Dissophora ornata]
GPQARCHEQADKSFHEFFVAIDGPSKSEYASYKDSSVFLEAYEGVPDDKRCFFEQIREGRACNEYYDIDWDLEQAVDENELQRLEQRVFAAFLRVRNQHAPDFALDDDHCRVLSASKDKSSKLKDLRLGQPGRPLLRAAWHGASMVAEDEEFLISNIRSDHVKVIFSAQEIAVARAPATTSRSKARVFDSNQSSLPKHIVDAVRAKFMQTSQAAQFKMRCVVDAQRTKFELDRVAPGHCVKCKRVHDKENAFLILSESGTIFLHCYRSTQKGVSICNISVEVEADVALQTPHAAKIHADITDDARYLTHFPWSLAPQLEPLELEDGKLTKTIEQPPSLLIRCDTGGGKTVFVEALITANP